MKPNNLIIGCLCAFGCETLYGLSYIFTKAAMQTASPFTLLGWRFIIAITVIGICIYFRLIKINLKGKPLKPLLIVSLFSPCIYFIGETIGISHTTASESGVFLATIPVASLIASTLILKNKPSKLQIIGIFITLSGVLVTIFAVGVTSSLSGIGYISLFASVISYALFSVHVEKSNFYTEVEITFIMLVAGALVFGILAICEAIFYGTVKELFLFPFTESSFFMAIMYQGIGCSILAFFLYNVAISKIGVNRTSSFIGVATVVSIVAGAFFLDETFSIYQIAGVLVIITGVYIANYKVDRYN